MKDVPTKSKTRYIIHWCKQYLLLHGVSKDAQTSGIVQNSSTAVMKDVPTALRQDVSGRTKATISLEGRSIL